MTFAFARFDLQSWLPRTQTLLPLAFIAVVGFILPIPGMAIAASAFVTTLIVSAPFLGDERGRLDTLYGVLPVSRRTIVAGRALAIFAYGILALATANAVTVAAVLVRGGDLAPEILLIANAAAFAITGLAMSIQLPVFFRIGYSRGRLVGYAPALIVAGLAWLGQATGTITTENFSGIPVSLVVGVGFGVGVVGIIVGTLVSMRIYQSRELR